MLYLDDFGDTAAAEEVLAMGDDGLNQGIHADGALLLAFDDKLEGLLQESAVFVIEQDDTWRLDEFHQIGDALSAEGPVITGLAKAEKPLKHALKPTLLTRVGPALEVLQGVLSLSTGKSQRQISPGGLA